MSFNNDTLIWFSYMSSERYLRCYLTEISMTPLELWKKIVFSFGSEWKTGQWTSEDTLKPLMLSSSVSEASINTLSDVRMILLMLSGGHICYAWQIWSLLLTNDIWRIIKIIISSIDVSWWKEQCSVNCVKMKYGLWRMMVIKWLRG